MTTATMYKSNIWMWGGWGNWFKEDTDPTTLQEVHTRKLEEPRDGYFRGMRTFVSTTADAVAGADSLHGNVFPNWPGALSGEEPTVCKTAITWGFIQGLALIHAFYESTGVGFCRIFTKDINRPIVRKFMPGYEGDMSDSVTAGQGAAYIIDGREIDGIHEWRVVSGRNDWLAGHMFFRIDTSYAVGTALYHTWEALRNKVNSDAVVIGPYGTWAIGTLWFHGASTNRERFGNIVDVSLYFEYNASLWSTACKTQRGVWVSEEHFVLDTTGKQTTESRTRMVYKPGKYLTAGGVLTTWTGSDAGGKTTSKAIGATAAFSTLNLGTLVGW